MTPRTIALLGVLTAWVAALGFVLSPVPNVELMTLSTFLAGALLGVSGGALVGSLAMAIFSGLNPYGMAPPPVFVSQVIGLACVGAVGGVVGLRSLPLTPVTVVAFAALGFVLTLFYDALTNFGTAVVMGAFRNPWPVLAGGLAFSIWHMVFNALFFAIGAPPILELIRRRRARLLS
jgi:uncharacterized membrane protein